MRVKVVKINSLLMSLAKFALVLFIQHTQNFAEAQYFTSPSASSMGGTGRAAVEPADGLFLNPAVVALAGPFELDAYFRDGYLEAQQHENVFGLSVMDNSDDVVVPGAITYLRGHRTFPGLPSVDEQLWQFSVAKFYSQRLAFGIMGNYLSQRPQVGKKVTQWNAGVGLAYHFHSSFSLAGSFMNFLDQGDDVPAHLRQPPILGLGIRYMFDKVFEARADVYREEKFNPDKKASYGLGLKVFALEFLNFHFGGRWEGLADRTLATAGLCFNGPKIKIDYSFEKNVDRTRGAMHSVDIRVPF